MACVVWPLPSILLLAIRTFSRRERFSFGGLENQVPQSLSALGRGRRVLLHERCSLPISMRTPAWPQRRKSSDKSRWRPLLPTAILTSLNRSRSLRHAGLKGERQAKVKSVGATTRCRAVGPASSAIDLVVNPNALASPSIRSLPLCRDYSLVLLVFLDLPYLGVLLGFRECFDHERCLHTIPAISTSIHIRVWAGMSISSAGPTC